MGALRNAGMCELVDEYDCADDRPMASTIALSIGIAIDQE